VEYTTHPPATFPDPTRQLQAPFPSTYHPEALIAGPSRLAPPHEETLQQQFLANPTWFGTIPNLPTNTVVSDPLSTHHDPEATSEQGPAAVPGVLPHELPSSTQEQSNNYLKEKKSGKAKPMKTKKRKNPYAREKPRTDGLIPMPPKAPLGKLIDGKLNFEITASAHPNLFSLLSEIRSDPNSPGMKYLPIPYPGTFQRALRYLPPPGTPFPLPLPSTTNKRRATLDRGVGRPKKAFAHLGFVDECACVCGHGFGADHSTANHITVRKDAEHPACEVYYRQRRAPERNRCIFCKQAMSDDWGTHFSACVMLKEVRTLILKDHIEDHGLLPCEIDMFPWPAAELGETPTKKL
jgi:hypothetical protein